MWHTLPPDVLDAVLLLIDDVEVCACVSLSMRDAVRVHLAPTRVRVGDCVARALARARPGATLAFDAGHHHVEGALYVHARVRLVSLRGDDPGDCAVLVSRVNALLRASAPLRVEHMTLCCAGMALCHNAAVVHQLAGSLVLHHCTVTYSSPEESVGVIQPTAGVWVSPKACVHLVRCSVHACMGPALRIEGGTVLAEDSTLAHSVRGSNVVARGGVLQLHRCRIHSAAGDGISLWYNVCALLDSNQIFENGRTGIACHENTHARIQRNSLRGNRGGSFSLGSCRSVTLHNNTILH